MKPKRISTSTDRLKKHQREINDLYGLNRSRSTPQSVASSESATASAGSNTANGNFLKTSGGVMVGAIAYNPVVMNILNQRINISQSERNPPDFSSYVLASGIGNLNYIDGAAYNGQILIYQGTNQQIQTIKTRPQITGQARTIIGTTDVEVIVDDTSFLKTGDRVDIDSSNGGLDKVNVPIEVVTPTIFVYDLGVHAPSGIQLPVTVTFGNIYTEDGNDIVLDGSKTNYNAPIVQLIYDVTINGWRTIQDPTSGGGGTSFPIRYPLDDFGNQGNVTLDIPISDTDGQNKRVTMTGDIGFVFSYPPLGQFLQEIWITFVQDSVGNHNLTTVPPNVKNGALLNGLLDHAPNARTLFHFITEDDGISYHADLVDLDSAGGGDITFPIRYPVTDVTPTAGNITLNLNNTNGHYFDIGPITGDITITFTNPPVSGVAQAFRLNIAQDSVGGHAVTFTNNMLVEPILGDAPDQKTLLAGDVYDGLVYNIFTMTSTIGSGQPIRSLNDLSDVTISQPSSDQILFYNNTSNQWINRGIVQSDIPSLNASKITAGVFDIARIPVLSLQNLSEYHIGISPEADHLDVPLGMEIRNLGYLKFNTARPTEIGGFQDITIRGIDPRDDQSYLTALENVMNVNVQGRKSMAVSSLATGLNTVPFASITEIFGRQKPLLKLVSESSIFGPNPSHNTYDIGSIYFDARVPNTSTSTVDFDQTTLAEIKARAEIGPVEYPPWNSLTYYVKGDKVSYSNQSYICVNAFAYGAGQSGNNPAATSAWDSFTVQSLDRGRLDFVLRDTQYTTQFGTDDFNTILSLDLDHGVFINSHLTTKDNAYVNLNGIVNLGANDNGLVNVFSNMSINANRITNLAEPTGNQDAATKNYVDSNNQQNEGGYRFYDKSNIFWHNTSISSADMNSDGGFTRNRIYAILYVPTKNITISKLGINCTTAGSSSGRIDIGIYNVNSSNLEPSNKLVNGFITQLVAEFKTINISPTNLISGTPYFFIFKWNDSIPNADFAYQVGWLMTPLSMNENDLDLAGNVAMSYGWSGAYDSIGIPNNGSSVSWNRRGGNLNSPSIMFKVSG